VRCLWPVAYCTHSTALQIQTRRSYESLSRQDDTKTSRCVIPLRYAKTMLLLFSVFVYTISYFWNRYLTCTV